MALVVKSLHASARDARDVGSIPGSRRSPGVGNCDPLQYPWLNNTMNIVHGIVKSSSTGLSD